MISFTTTKVDKDQKEVIIAKIRYNANSGKLTLEDVSELEMFTRNILSNLGFSNQEIVSEIEKRFPQYFESA